MRKLILSLLVLFSVALSAQNIEGFVSHQMQVYPKSRLLDLYKSCFQDFMGAEHLVSNREKVKAYLDDELNSTTLDELMPRQYEPCGTDSCYYRVSIRTVKEGIISEVDSILSVGKYAISHSPEYREAYRPHYRIVERSIFERELLPLIEQKSLVVRIAEIAVIIQHT